MVVYVRLPPPTTSFDRQIQWRNNKPLYSFVSAQNVTITNKNIKRRIEYITRTISLLPFRFHLEPLCFSTQLNEHLWTQVLKHLSVHICLVYQVLQSTWFAYWSVANSGQVGRFTTFHHPKFSIQICMELMHCTFKHCRQNVLLASI